MGMCRLLAAPHGYVPTACCTSWVCADCLLHLMGMCRLLAAPHGYVPTACCTSWVCADCLLHCQPGQPCLPGPGRVCPSAHKKVTELLQNVESIKGSVFRRQLAEAQLRPPARAEQGEPAHVPLPNQLAAACTAHVCRGLRVRLSQRYTVCREFHGAMQECPGNCTCLWQASPPGLPRCAAAWRSGRLRFMPAHTVWFPAGRCYMHVGGKPVRLNDCTQWALQGTAYAVPLSSPATTQQPLVLAN